MDWAPSIKNFAPKIEKAVIQLSEKIKQQFPELPNSRWVAFRLLEGDERIINAFKTGEFLS